MSRTSWLLATGALLVSIGWWVSSSTMLVPNGDALVAPTKIARAQIQNLRDFFAKVATVESIDDPVQRCLAYPDPPGSHWSRDAVSLYCRYRLEPVMSSEEIAGLVQQGRAAEVDRRFADALKQQLSHSGTPGLLDRIYYRSFRMMRTPTLRNTVDGWKRQSPDSAFAYAASGMLYVSEAQQTRGDAFAEETPSKNFVAMGKLLKSAKTDLEKAVKIDSHVVPAYAAMIYAAGLAGDNQYANDAGKRALDVDPSSFSIYSQLSWLAQPKWGGSLEAMRRIIAEAQQHADANPLLVLLLPDADAAQAGLDSCNCKTVRQILAYKAVFDHAPTGSVLVAAAIGAAASGQSGPDIKGLEVKGVYLSEALRFYPDMRDLRMQRNALMARLNMQSLSLARADAERMVASAPHDPDALQMLGSIEHGLHDDAAAERDYLAVLAIRPDSRRTQNDLGQIYVDKHQWDTGWTYAESLIREHPASSEGWFLRAKIQKYQPRPGLRDTYDYFAAHFNTRPDSSMMIEQYDEQEQFAQMSYWLGLDPYRKMARQGR